MLLQKLRKVVPSIRFFSSNQRLNQERVQVEVSYTKLRKQEKDSDLFENIEKAFSREGFGIIVINGIPSYKELRRNLLLHSHKVANLPKEDLESLSSPETRYTIGFNPGNVAGEVDHSFQKSFIAWPNQEKILMFDGKEYENIWPTSQLPEFESLTRKMERLQQDVAIDLGRHIDYYLAEKAGVRVKNFSVEQIVVDTFLTPTKLLHYLPPQKEVDLWCDWHVDFGFLTALTSSLYTNPEGEEVMNVGGEGGLVIQRTDTYQELKLSIPEDSLAIQAGESMQIVTGGLITACPHAVLAPSPSSDLRRNRFVTFIYPNPDVVLDLPEGRSWEDAFGGYDPEKRYISIPERWEPGMKAQMYLDNSMMTYFS